MELLDGGGSAGLESLSLASVAAHAGVATPSLYKHVASLKDLRRLVSVASVEQLTEVIASATIGRSADGALRAAGDAVRSFGHEFPGRYLAAQIAANPDDPADADLIVSSNGTLKVLGAMLRGFDLPQESHVDAVRMFRSAVHGFILLEINGGFGLPDDVDRSFSVLMDALVGQVHKLSTL